MIESQIIGGSAIGQILNEQIKYDEDGQLLTATLSDAGITNASSSSLTHRHLFLTGKRRR
jgi:CO/xanthine dehydrogenase Mo-binding subunit